MNAKSVFLNKSFGLNSIERPIPTNNKSVAIPTCFDKKEFHSSYGKDLRKVLGLVVDRKITTMGSFKLNISMLRFTDTDYINILYGVFKWGYLRRTNFKDKLMDPTTTFYTTVKARKLLNGGVLVKDRMLSAPIKNEDGLNFFLYIIKLMRKDIDVIHLAVYAKEEYRKAVKRLCLRFQKRLQTSPSLHQRYNYYVREYVLRKGTYYTSKWKEMREVWAVRWASETTLYDLSAMFDIPINVLKKYYWRLFPKTKKGPPDFSLPGVWVIPTR